MHISRKVQKQLMKTYKMPLKTMVKLYCQIKYIDSSDDSVDAIIKYMKNQYGGYNDFVDEMVASINGAALVINKDNPRSAIDSMIA